MLRALLSPLITRFERDLNYDAGYLREILAASPWTFLKFAVVTTLAPHKDAPAEALAAAGLLGTLAEDCGPCTQLGIDLASRAGVRPEVLRAILSGDEAGMGENAALAYRFARASLERRLDEADRWRDEVVRRWGRKGLVALSLNLMAARMYPTVKYALGHGRTCSRIEVDGEPAPLKKPLQLAA
jgi:hypothetical protein